MLLSEEKQSYQISRDQDISKVDLLAGIIKPDNQRAKSHARTLLHKFGSLRKLRNATLEEIASTAKIGHAGATRIKTALLLGEQMCSEARGRNPVISQSRDAYDCIGSTLRNLDHEEFWILALDRKNEVIGTIKISQGGTAGTIVDAKIVFRKLIEAKAAGTILIHNHPSGSLKPSQADFGFTKNLVEIGKALDLNVLDHLIVSDQGYYSFADEGQL